MVAQLEADSKLKMGVRVRLRTPSGQHAISVDDGITAEQLRALVEEACAIPAAQQQLLVGYPPKVMTGDHRWADGDTIIVRDEGSGVNAAAAPSPAAPLASAPVAPDPAPTSAPPASSEGVAARKVILADNNCLFASLVHVLALSQSPQTLREAVKHCVLEDPSQWCEAILGMEPLKYCAWITEKDHWGGEIELQILSRHFRKQIAAFDIVSGQVYRYGQEEGFAELVCVLYDGIHYDAIILLPVAGAPEEFATTVFAANDERIVELAKRLQQEAHANRQFTDTAKFDLRCLVCQAGLVGEKGAQEHAKATGHVNFSEY
ncbi:hypothetical protein T492DRAFT_982232 [Pavlovales sp. CCMP2436]|nr:hypothetical protein T492DRAFT_982232 [Pavlovales sp. CCMP2436]|mmetsp:Transcript_1466/g.3785  ORF Transcript_1466/g.3785 Transcript_1466/m.3785 type:complete len:319 (-) Transcript_1466:157-1113(-)